MNFTHLQVQSTYSLLLSNIDIKALVRQASSLGFESLALTDTNVMYGAIPFYEACVKEGVEPILGLKLTIKNVVTADEKPNAILLLAKNNKGYENLVALSSEYQVHEEKPLNQEVLRNHTEGLIAITLGDSGELVELVIQENIEGANQLVATFQSMFADFYIGLSRVSERAIQSSYKLLKIAKDQNTPTVALNDVRVLQKEDTHVVSYLECIQQGTRLEEHVPEEGIKEKYLKTEMEMEELFQDSIESIQNTKRIAEQCQVIFTYPFVELPKFPIPEGVTSEQYLTQLCKRGAEKRYGNLTNEIVTRLTYELDVISKMKFQDYFLIVWDFIRFARTNGILTGPGRGSAAGSLVAYVLGITDIDPIEYDLLFERFLNPERISMPDIDLDFPDDRRDDVIQYVRHKYGSEFVAHILTFGTFGAKAAIRDVGRVEGLTPKELDGFSKRIPSRLNITLREAYEESKAFREYVEQTEVTKRIYHVANAIEGLPRHTSIHAAGVIISPIPFGTLVPVQNGVDGVLVTQYPADILEKLGFLKMDFLGLRNLKMIHEIVQSIKYNHGMDIPIRDLTLEDEKAYELFQKGDTLGVFQFESPGMRKFLKELKPTVFEDLVAMNALYRPGPMEQVPTFIRNKHQNKRDALGIAEINEVLYPTYGIIIYQEQIMKITSIMAKFSLGDADLLRRAISKKKKEVLDQERIRFVKGCVENGYSEELGNKVYDLIVKFANYGFNRSHSVAYSRIAYQMAYLKANYPQEFYTAVLSNVIGSEEKTSMYLKEARRKGLQIYPPSVLKSVYSFSREKDGLRFGLGTIKNIGWSTVKEIMDERKKAPFKDYYDFIVRMNLQGFSRKTFEQLIYAGALDDFGFDRSTLLGNLDSAIDYVELIKPMLQDNQLELFSMKSIVPKPNMITMSPMTEEIKAQYEKDSLGLYITVNPFAKLTNFANDERYINLDRVGEIQGQKPFYVAVALQEIRVIKTKKNDQMAFVVLADETDEKEGVIFPKTYQSVFLQLKTGSFVICQCKKDVSREKDQLIIENIWPLGVYDK